MARFESRIRAVDHITWNTPAHDGMKSVAVLYTRHFPGEEDPLASISRMRLRRSHLLYMMLMLNVSSNLSSNFFPSIRKLQCHLLFTVLLAKDRRSVVQQIRLVMSREPMNDVRDCMFYL